MDIFEADNLPAGDAVLCVRDVHKTFRLSYRQRRINRTSERTKIAVDGLSFSAANGEIYGLLGPNGAGKTTAMRMISTLIKCDSGDITVYGDSVKTAPDKVRAHLAFLTSELKLEEYFTPDYLFDFYAQLHGIAPDVRSARKESLFQKFGIGSFRGVKIAELSTGMKQKVSIAVSLAHDPKVIIYDEPTNGLDVITAKIVTDFLLELKREGKCIIVSTHIFGLVEKVCDRVGIIVNGKMAKEGTLLEVCAGRKLEDVFFDTYYGIVGDNN
jgi:sodium transport system ATP-binding protein